MRFSASVERRFGVNVAHDEGVGVAVGGEVVQEVEVGVEQVAAARVQLLDVAPLGTQIRR
jgi:hypothetical protein